MSHPHGRTILLVARGADPVGTGREVEIAATAFAATGADVHVAFTSAGGSLSKRLAAAGVRVHAVGRRLRPDAAAIGRLAGLLEFLRPRTVLSWGRSQAVAAAAATRPRSWRPSRPRLVCRVALSPRGLVDAWALTRADLVAASSATVTTACRKAGVSVHRLETIEPAADAAPPAGLSRHEVAMRLGLAPEKIWSLCVAPLVAAARLDRLLWAIDQLGVVRHDVEHVLVGEGPQFHRLRRRARVQHLADRLRIVSFADCLPDLLREVRFVWQSGDVALGGALFDALSAGKPIVAVASDAARQAIVDGETGWIASPLPESELPRRAFSIIEDGGLADRFAAAGRERAAAHFSGERFVAALRVCVPETARPPEPHRGDDDSRPTHDD